MTDRNIDEECVIDGIKVFPGLKVDYVGSTNMSVYRKDRSLIYLKVLMEDDDGVYYATHYYSLTQLNHMICDLLRLRHEMMTHFQEKDLKEAATEPSVESIAEDVMSSDIINIDHIKRCL